MELMLEKIKSLHTAEIFVREKFNKNHFFQSKIKENIEKQKHRFNLQIMENFNKKMQQIYVGNQQNIIQQVFSTRDRLFIQLFQSVLHQAMNFLIEQSENQLKNILINQLHTRFLELKEELEYYTHELTFQEEENHGSSQDFDKEIDKEEKEYGIGMDAVQSSYKKFYMEEIEFLWLERCQSIEILQVMKQTIRLENKKKKKEKYDDKRKEFIEKIHSSLFEWQNLQWPTKLNPKHFVFSTFDCFSSSQKEKKQDTEDKIIDELKYVLEELTKETSKFV
jgi:hypothetical protein